MRLGTAYLDTEMYPEAGEYLLLARQYAAGETEQAQIDHYLSIEEEQRRTQ